MEVKTNEEIDGKLGALLLALHSDSPLVILHKDNFCTVDARLYQESNIIHVYWQQPDTDGFHMCGLCIAVERLEDVVIKDNKIKFIGEFEHTKNAKLQDTVISSPEFSVMRLDAYTDLEKRYEELCEGYARTMSRLTKANNNK